MSGKSSKMKSDTKKKRKTTKRLTAKKRSSKKSSLSIMGKLEKDLYTGAELEDYNISEGIRKNTIREANQLKEKIRDLISKQGRVTKTRITKPSQTQQEADEEKDASFKIKEANKKKTDKNWLKRKDNREMENIFGKLGGKRKRKRKTRKNKRN